MKQSLINPKLMLHAQKRCWPLWLSFLVAWILGLILPLAIFASSGSLYNASDVAMQSGWNIEYGASIVGTMIAAGLSAVFVWEYLFKNSAAMFYGSAPISRTGLFATMFAAGLIPLLAIELLVEAVLLVFAVLMPAVTASACLTWLGMTAGCTFAFYCIAVLSAQLSGNRGMSFVVFILLCTGLYQVELLFTAITRILLPTVVFEGGLLVWASPAIALMQYCLGDSIQWLPLIVYCLLGVSLVAIAAVLNERRNLEVAGSAVAIRGAAGALKVVLSAIVAVFFGLATLFLLSVGGETSQNVTLIQMLVFSALLVMGAFLGAVLTEAAFKRGLNAWAASWKQGLAVSACCLVLVGSVYFDAFGSESYVPNAENVEQVQVKSGYGDYFGDAIITEPEDINEIISIHRQFIERNDDEAWRERHLDLEYALGDVVISYIMSDGEKITRAYTYHAPGTGSLTVDEEIVRRLDELVCSKDVIDSWLGEYLNYSVKGYGVSLYYEDGKVGKSETLSNKEFVDFVDNALVPDIRHHGAFRMFGDEANPVLGSVTFGANQSYTINVTKERCPNILKWFKEKRNLDLTKDAIAE